MRVREWYLSVALLLAVSLSRHASAQISPGPLSTAHQDLEGASKCTTCHAFGLGQRALKCLDCHGEINRRVAAKQGYHATAYKASEPQLDCARCHAEHNGRRFQLTKFDRTSFDHATLTGFALQGKHAIQKCESCHNAGLVRVRSDEIKMKDLNRTFFGLATDCAVCHKDAHNSQLSATCTKCHTQEAWKPASAFSHNNTSYPLTGKHQNVGCVNCHRAGASGPIYIGLRYSSCDTCHTDPHKGAFQNAAFQGTCQICHITSDWKAVKSDAGFSHERTKFPLLGAHAQVGCLKCHQNSDFSKIIAHALCADCHKDVHAGQFVNRAAGGDCSACHSDQTFKPSLFTRDRHQQTKFPLEGKHVAVECANCHKSQGPDTKYSLGISTCQGCHQDPHGAQFASEPHGNKCESCHTQSAFHPSTYTIARHQGSAFALTGAHAAVLCADCHKPLSTRSVVAERQYHFATQNCTNCHQDPHQTRQTCDTCHSTAQWKVLRAFDHTRTKFSLEGAHKNVTCIGCHRPLPNTSANLRTVNLSSTPTQCHECHEDIHAGQFMQAGEEKECTLCHTITTWSSRSFDHDQTSFPLDGAHDQVNCAKCHTKIRRIEHREVRWYRDAPVACAACHADGTPVAN